MESGYKFDFLIGLVAGVVFIWALVYCIFRSGGFGGADAKALIALAIMFPLYPAVDLAEISLPIAGHALSPIFALTVLGNAVALNIVVPLWMFVYNLATIPPGELISNPVGSFTGYRARISDLKGKHLRLMHHYDETDDRVSRKWAFKGSEIDDDSVGELTKWQKAGKIDDKVWVTPRLPFLIPITLGFLAGVFYGDILMLVISTLMGR